MILLLLFGKHLMYSRPNPGGGMSFYYYYDAITWVAGAVALASLTWFVVSRVLRARRLRRPRRPQHRKLPKRTMRAKRELSSVFLQPGFSRTIHALGIGMLANGQHCIQVFINDANEEMWVGARGAPLPTNYRGVPVVPIEMPMASFLSAVSAGTLNETAPLVPYPRGIRDAQEVIIGGISGANTHLEGQSGTIGYFCTRKSRLTRRKEIHLLSNSHVFADLRKGKVDESDIIMQPSPGEAASNRPIGALVNFSALKFETKDPNHVDAAIAKLWSPQPHKPVIPQIGAIKGHVRTQDLELGEVARKFGRTTGYTEGRVFSVNLDIWIRYDRTGQSAFFQDQILIEPSLPRFAKFVSKGDSGSLVVDGEQRALGLIFAGMAELPETVKTQNKAAGPKVEQSTVNQVAAKPQRIESYGVANPISEVLDRLKIDLLVE